MRRLIPLFALCGCFASEGLMNSQACIADHAQRQIGNLKEIARMSESYPVSPIMADLLRENAKSAIAVQAWAELAQSHIGRAEAPPKILTDAEVGSQTLYRQEIEARKNWSEALPLKVPGIGGGGEFGGILKMLAGGGPFAAISTALGIMLKRKHKQERQTREQSHVANAAAIEAMNLIRMSPDPQLKKRAANQPNLLRMYSEQKLAEYDTRIMRLERGGYEDRIPEAQS